MSKEIPATIQKDQSMIIPKVRECSFQPENYFIQIASISKQGAMENYLEVKFRVLWFQKYCEENNITGFIDDSEVTFMPECGILKATCSIYMNDKLVSKASSGQLYDGTNGNTVIQSAATSAKGRALSNLGFGTAMGAFEEKEDIPCEAGVSTADSAPNELSNPMMQPGNQPTEKTPINMPATFDEALSVVIDFGQYKGKTLGEVNALNSQYVSFCAYKLQRHPEITKAAQLILANCQ